MIVRGEYGSVKPTSFGVVSEIVLPGSPGRGYYRFIFILKGGPFPFRFKYGAVLRDVFVWFNRLVSERALLALFRIINYKCSSYRIP
jgi:hypothetical protein